MTEKEYLAQGLTDAVRKPSMGSASCIRRAIIPKCCGK